MDALEQLAKRNRELRKELDRTTDELESTKLQRDAAQQTADAFEKEYNALAKLFREQITLRDHKIIQLKNEREGL